MKVRVKFSKEGPVKFIGHLDVMRYFQKAVRRAELDIAYSAGFSPHQIMSFASPLSVGHTSVGEYFDMELVSLPKSDTGAALSEKEACEAIKNRFNQVMTEGICVLDTAILSEKEENAMASVAAAAYLVFFRNESLLPAHWKEQLLAFYEQDSIPVLKKTKKGEKEIDLKAGIYELKATEEGVYLFLDAGSGTNLKPGFVLETFFASIGFPLPPFAMQVHRLETYRKGEEVENFLPLIS